ncbi:MAG: class I SAM-dependent methyltransferase [Deltaproteobacteria bacterium]|nr:class I SAM-dependent methyltransferase [Deltaproteobacteria bacterium]
MNNKVHNGEHYHRCCKHKHGPSSFWLHNPKLVFGELKLKEGDSFLDLGCGTGDYAIHATEIVGKSGVVYALDKWKKLVDDLQEKADSQELDNIKAMVVDITGALPLGDNCVDVCFLATVMHTLNLAKDGNMLFGEIRRVLKREGRVAIIECKKEDMPFGPPIHMRLSAESVEDSVTQYGFEKINVVDLGYNYLIQFRLQ